MTMLTPTRGRFERAAYSSGSRDGIGAGGAGARLATVRRFCISALLVVGDGRCPHCHHGAESHSLSSALSLLMHAEC